MFGGAMSEGASGYEEELPTSGWAHQHDVKSSYQQISGLEKQIQQHHVRYTTLQHSSFCKSLNVHCHEDPNILYPSISVNCG